VVVVVVHGSSRSNDAHTDTRKHMEKIIIVPCVKSIALLRRFMNNRDQRSCPPALAPFPRNLPRKLSADSPIPLRYARSGRQGSAGAHALSRQIKCSEIYQDRVSSNHLLADGRAKTNTSSSFLSFFLFLRVFLALPSFRFISLEALLCLAL